MSKATLEMVGGVMLCGILCLVSAGCQGTATTEAVSVETVVVDPLNPPSGHVLRVWTNGASMVDIGTEVGVADGDWLCILRGGKEVQYLEVSDARPNVSYCRVAVRENPTRPKVDDVVVLEPKGLRDMHGSVAE